MAIIYHDNSADLGLIRNWNRAMITLAVLCPRVMANGRSQLRGPSFAGANTGLGS